MLLWQGGNDLRSHVKTLFVVSAMVAFFATFGLADTPAKKPPQPGAKPPSKSSHRASARQRGPRKGAWKRHGQQKIEAGRVRDIQEALIREKFLEGNPTGTWDTRTQAAMTHYQATHGWQSKVTPDSRALIKLGLGPNHAQDGSLNFEAKPGVPAVAASAPAKDTAGSGPNRQ